MVHSPKIIFLYSQLYKFTANIVDSFGFVYLYITFVSGIVNVALDSII